MPVDFTEAAREAYAVAPTNVVMLETLELRHSAFRDDDGNPTALRVVADNQDLVATLEADAPMNPGQAVTFTRFAFEVDEPAVESSGAAELVIRICNVSREISRNCARAKETTEKVSLTHRLYLSTETSAPQRRPMTLTVSSVSIAGPHVEIRASFPNLSNKRFPAEAYTGRRFPGLLL